MEGCDGSTRKGSENTKRLMRPMQIRSRIVVREFKSGDWPDLYAETPPLEALKAIISIAASHSPEFSLIHADVSSAYFHAKAQEAHAGGISSRRLVRKGQRDKSDC